MSGELLVSFFYNALFYGSFACFGLPVLFFGLWTYIDFFKKHIALFYIFAVLVFLVSSLGFYFAEKYWIFWYYSFPAWVQVVGLGLCVFSTILIKLCELTIGRWVRMFYPLLKGNKFKLKTSGVYAIVRHPIYAAFPMFIFGALLYTGQLVLFLPLIFNLFTRTWYAKKEEQYIQDKIEGDYHAYMKKTPHRFYPKFF